MCSRRRLVHLAAFALVVGCGDDAPVGGTAAEAGETSTSEGLSTGTDPDEGVEAGADETDAGEAGEASTDTGDPSCDPNSPTLTEQDYLAAGESAAGVSLPACEDHVWWVSAAAGVETTVSVDASGPVEVAISYPDDPSFTAALTTTTLYRPGKLEFVAPRSGEFAVLLRPQNPAADPELSVGYDLAVACTNQCERETTRFPIVLVHGWTGFENIGPIDYFYHVREDLEDLGYPIAVAVLDPYNAVEIRGEQLAAFVGATLSVQRARKLDLVGHSQGGIDSRYVASDAGAGFGGQIGAVVTIATPHYGTPVTDVALGLLPGAGEQALAFFLNFLGATQNQQSDAEASLYTLSETFMQQEFNLVYLDDPRVKYMSWSGETCVAGIGCDDSVDPLLLFSFQIIAGMSGTNDGLVSESSAKWGEYLGSIPADHIDEVGQIAGVTGFNYDHLAFFRLNARMLRDQRF